MPAKCESAEDVYRFKCFLERASYIFHTHTPVPKHLQTFCSMQMYTLIRHYENARNNCYMQDQLTKCRRGLLNMIRCIVTFIVPQNKIIRGVSISADWLDWVMH